MDSKKTGAFIAALRKEKGYTQANLAELLNISNRTVSKWENGDGFPDITILPDIASVFGITVDELLAGERAVKEETAQIKVTEIENKDNLVNIFKICFVIALFLAVFALVLGTVTEIYCIWAFPILFYTHWEIIFVAVSLFAMILSGLVFSVGVTRLGVSYNKDEIKRLAGRKGLVLIGISAVFPLSFIARLLNFSVFKSALAPHLFPFVMAFLVIASLAALKYAYDKIV